VTPYLGPEGCTPGRPTQAVRHTYSGILGIAKIFNIAPHKKKSIVNYLYFAGRCPLANGVLCLSTLKHNGKSGTDEMHHSGF
jgi:hypothetical protein